MAANVSVMAAAERTARTEQVATGDSHLRVRFRGTLQSLPGKRVPLSLPIYRMANTRTIVRQREYAESNELPVDYFKTGQENPTAQTAQHSFLVELAKNSRANIYGALEEQAEQTEPLIITVSGVVLNGNRRLAAMRELHDEDPVRFERFGHVDVAVLPADADEDDLTAIETALQIAPDLRLDYGWVEEALSLERQIEELNWDLAKASSYWGEGEADLNARLNRLTMAEEYLDYLHEGKYSVVADDEQAFTTLQQRQTRRSTVAPSLLEAERLVLYAVLANPDILDRRAYDYARSIDSITLQVVVRVPVATPPIEQYEPREGDPLSELPDSPDAVALGALEFLRQLDNSVAVATLAVEARNELDRRQRAGRRANEFLKSASQINSVATSMSLTNASEETIAPAVSQLVSSLVQLVKRLTETVQSHPAVVGQIDSTQLDSARSELNDLIDKLGE